MGGEVLGAPKGRKTPARPQPQLLKGRKSTKKAKPTKKKGVAKKKAVVKKKKRATKKRKSR
jgi:hypothetical protein